MDERAINPNPTPEAPRPVGPEQAPQVAPPEQAPLSPEQIPERVAPEEQVVAPQPVAPVVTPTMPPPVPTVAPVADDDSGPAVADDVDVIEMEWVNKAKQIIKDTKDDPYAQEQAVEKLQRDYLKKRYGKEIKAAS